MSLSVQFIPSSASTIILSIDTSDILAWFRQISVFNLDCGGWLFLVELFVDDPGDISMKAFPTIPFATFEGSQISKMVDSFSFFCGMDSFGFVLVDGFD